MGLCGARDGNNPRLLRQQPGDRDLGRCRVLSFCDRADQINQSLIRFSRLRRETWDDVTKICTVEFSALVDLPGEEAFTKRAKWHEADTEFLEGRDHFLFRRSGPQRVFALKC